ncbi:MAG: DinB family protein [Anaerolineales bacterium]|nr:DinB family protein [Anaerolineales bacterium]
MTHPLIDQLRFTRNEFQRGLESLSEADAARRLPPLNCISWNVGHLAWQEQLCFLYGGQKRILLPDVNIAYAYGAPACAPGLAEVQNAWNAVTAAVDPWLNSLVEGDMTTILDRGEDFGRYSIGNLLQRVIYHYWYHNGENLAIRQALGHTDLPQFVGDIDNLAPYRPA